MMSPAPIAIKRMKDAGGESYRKLGLWEESFGKEPGELSKWVVRQPLRPPHQVFLRPGAK